MSTKIVLILALSVTACIEPGGPMLFQRTDTARHIPEAQKAPWSNINSVVEHEMYNLGAPEVSDDILVFTMTPNNCKDKASWVQDGQCVAGVAIQWNENRFEVYLGEADSIPLEALKHELKHVYLLYEGRDGDPKHKGAIWGKYDH